MRSCISCVSVLCVCVCIHLAVSGLSGDCLSKEPRRTSWSDGMVADRRLELWLCGTVTHFLLYCSFFFAFINVAGVYRSETLKGVRLVRDTVNTSVDIGL